MEGLPCYACVVVFLVCCFSLFLSVVMGDEMCTVTVATPDQHVHSSVVAMEAAARALPSPYWLKLSIHEGRGWKEGRAWLHPSSDWTDFYYSVFISRQALVPFFYLILNRSQ